MIIYKVWYCKHLRNLWSSWKMQDLSRIRPAWQGLLQLPKHGEKGYKSNAADDAYTANGCSRDCKLTVPKIKIIVTIRLLRINIIFQHLLIFLCITTDMKAMRIVDLFRVNIIALSLNIDFVDFTTRIGTGDTVKCEVVPITLFLPKTNFYFRVAIIIPLPHWIDVSEFHLCLLCRVDNALEISGPILTVMI